MNKFNIYRLFFIFVLVGVLTLSSLYAGNFTEINPGTLATVDNSPVVVLGDIDNDGDLDLILSANAGECSTITKIYTNDGTGNFAELSSSIVGVNYGDIALGDIDNDGDLDLILAGDSAGNGCTLNGVGIIYQNDGTGNFTEVGSIDGFYYSSIALGDIDNDGDLDLVATGEPPWPGKSRIYKNDGQGNFSVADTNTLPGVSWGDVAFSDIDNDGDMDLILTGSYDDGLYTSAIYINGGQGNFSLKETLTPGVGSSSIAFGDIDADGDLDLILTGRSSSGYESHIYQNDGAGNFTEINAGSLTNVYFSSIALGDIDNDGDLDLILTGQSSSGYESHIYQNDGAGNFTEINAGSLTNVYKSSIALSDIDNDGDLDLILTGQSSSGYVTKIYQNDETTINTPPTVPSGMSASDNGGYWRFQWNKSTDDHTPQNILRYQIAIGTNSGVYDYASTNIDYPRGQANIGKVTVVSGNPYYQTRISTTKTVYWKVCAIDSAFKNSAYCSEQMTEMGPLHEFELAADKTRINPDGTDYAVVQNKETLRYNRTGLPITNGSKFYIEVAKGECEIEAETENGKYYVISENGNISFKVRGRTISSAEIKVYWAEDTSVTSSITILISPSMDIKDNNDAIVYNNVINPAQGDRVKIYINSEEGEEIMIYVIDIYRGKIVKKDEIAGGRMKEWEWDMVMNNGKKLPNGSFGVVIRGKDWEKRLKFIVNRRYNR